MDECVILRTSRLVARRPTSEDAFELFELMKSKELTDFLAWAPHHNVSETIEVISSLVKAQKLGKAFHWVITVKDEIIGIVSLINLTRQHRCWQLNRAELSYWLTEKHQNKGYATEISDVVIKFGFFDLSLNKIIVAHEETNLPSKKVINKLGFKQYALERDAYKKNDVWHNIVWYDLLKSEMNNE
jgi:RimJ/RimL family protein N-acetyltransferase